MDSSNTNGLWEVSKKAQGAYLPLGQHADCEGLDAHPVPKKAAEFPVSDF
jgi:hypothetical protein